jgi:hemerythrin-like domain-containing protein
MPKTSTKTKFRHRTKTKKLAERSPMMATLLAEHRHMTTMLKLLEKQLDLIERDGNVDAHVIYETMDYMTRYPDRFHHPREDVIYQRAAELSSDLADSVDTLQRDHDHMAKTGSEALQQVADWQKGECTGDSVVEAGRTYISELFRHMEVEEKLVFPQIESTLSISDWRELELDDNLLPSPDPVFGPRVDREFRNVARSARRALRFGVENAVIFEWLGLMSLWESLEVLSIARDNSRENTREHAHAIVKECREILADSPLLSPLKCAACGMRQSAGWIMDQFEISRDTLGDIGYLGGRIRAEMRDLRKAN